jgi:hypothetical protein
MRGRGRVGRTSPGGQGNSFNNNNFSNNTSGGSGSSIGKKNPCHICGKLGHNDVKCWYRYDQGNEEDHIINAATTSYNIDPSWYADTGATDHITHDLEKMAVKEKCQGNDQVATANGQGMYIRHIGQSKIHSASHTLILRNILHVPSITRNLLSVRMFAIDNHVFFEFHPHFLLIKDLATREILIRGWCQDGIYMLNLASLHTALQNSQVSKTRWHCRLGYASPQIVQKLISRFDLPCSSESNKHVCDAYQQAKIHQLPYSLSNNFVSNPLELVYSDVWEPARSTVHGEKYYVSFVDAYSRFTWVYLLR